MGSGNIKAAGTIGFNFNSIQAGQAQLNRAISNAENLITVCQSLQAQARGLPDGNGSVAGYMGSALSVANGIKATLSSVNGSITSTVSAYSAATSKAMGLISQIGGKYGSRYGSSRMSATKGANRLNTRLGQRGRATRSGMKQQGAQSMWNSYTKNSKDYRKQAGAFFTSAGASWMNFNLSVAKGIGSFGEDLVDLAAMAGTAVVSAKTGIFDGISYLVHKATGSKGKWESTTAKMWSNTMAFVSKDHVGSSFNHFYKNTTVGKQLDKHAWGPFKSDGIGCKIGSGVGYVAGTVALAVVTGGGSLAAQGGRIAVTQGGKVVATQVAKRTTTQTIKSTLKSMGRYETVDDFREGMSDSWVNTEGQGKTTGERMVQAMTRGAVSVARGKAGGKVTNKYVQKQAVSTASSLLITPMKSAYDSAETGNSVAQSFEARGGLETIFVGASTKTVPKRVTTIKTDRSEVKSHLETRKVISTIDSSDIRRVSTPFGNKTDINSTTVLSAEARVKEIAQQQTTLIKTQGPQSKQVIELGKEIYGINDRLKTIKKQEAILDDPKSNKIQKINAQQELFKQEKELNKILKG